MIEAVIGFAGVIVGAAITVAREVVSARLNRERTGSYAAVRIVSILEEYADACVDVVQDDGTAYGRPAGRTTDGQEFLKAQVTTPAFPVFPIDIEWRSLDASLMHQALSLPNKARTVERTIEIAADFGTPPNFEEVFDARHRGYASLGLDALRIANSLRLKYGIDRLPDPSMRTDWDLFQYLQEQQKRILRAK